MRTGALIWESFLANAGKLNPTPDMFCHMPPIPLLYTPIQNKNNLMTTQEVAAKWAEYGRTGQWDKAREELYADHCISLEMEGAQGPQRVEGIEGIKMKGKQWNEMVEEFHSLEIEGPMTAGNHFSASMKMDISYKGQGRMIDEEICVFQVEDGKIVVEQFFYPVPS